ncbi:hypothetical protein SAMN05421797_104100 [Maribacter ulvicola]|uniref:Uncharacterized protein n=1 Tax=Maribacter ulvicola TaxID=228959 RepID=A0A1N6WIK3_9FLAO|nr:hypothetical protein SAMN05421797_104100 [Maribacter ulvicola]
MVSTIPPNEKYSPFLNTVVFGINLQKNETTKNNSDSPKNMFRKYTGLLVVTLCRCSILSKIKGSSIFFVVALPVAVWYSPCLSK